MQKKTALDYALKHNNTNILRLFLDFFYEIKENKKRKYDKLETKHQERSKKLLDYANIPMSISSMIVSACMMSHQSKSKMEIFTCISIICSAISFLFFLWNLVSSRQKEPVKHKIENYTEKINRIEEVTGKLAKTKVGVHDLEGYDSIWEVLAEDASRLENMLNKLTHAASLESKNKLNSSPQKMSRCGSAVPCSNKSLEGRRSLPVLNDLTAKLSLCSRCNSRVQDTTDKLDNASCLITINEHSESKPKTPKNKFKNVATKLKIGNIFKKKKDPVDLSNLLGSSYQENIAKRNEEKHELIKWPDRYSIFSTPFNPSCSTSREEEFGTADRVVRRMSYGTIKTSPSVSEEGASKFPFTTLSSPGAEVAIKEEEFFGLGGHRPRAQTSPPCMSRKGIAGRVLKLRIPSDQW